MTVTQGASDPLIGRVIGKCRVERPLGQGGMGAVYLGTHETLRVPVAVKFLQIAGVTAGTNATAVDGAAAARFMREAQLAVSLRHPNIVRIIDLGNEQGLYYIVMELLSGTTLTSIVESRGALPIDQAKHIGHQVAAALAHAHAKGIVHRDVKPDNVMVSPDGTAVLTDFGIAAATSAATDQRLTRQGSVVGTPWYLAPEQARGGEVDARADIYAFGVMLYEMLTGQLPFEGSDGMAQMLARLTEDPIAITSRRRDLPPELVTLVGRMLARKPEDRVQTADEVAVALGGAQADRTVALPPPMAMTAEAQAVSARSSELTQMAESAGLPFATPPGAHMVELRLADIRATLRLAEDESAEGASLLLVHRAGEADLVGFIARRPVITMRVARGAPAPMSLADVLGTAMRRGDGAMVVRRIEPRVVNALRCWLEGPRALGPLAAELVRPMGLFSRLRRTKTSGVLAMTERGQTSLVNVVDGAVAGLLTAPLHRQEIATETEGGIGVWIESCTPDALLTFAMLPAGGAVDAARASVVPDATLQGALAGVAEAVKVLAGEASREFGLGSAQVFSKYLRQSTSPVRDIVPVAALSGPNAPVDMNAIWQSLAGGAATGRDLAVKMVAEAVLTGAVNAANEVLPPKKIGKVKQSALAAALKAKPALDALELGPVVQRLLAG